MGRIDFSDLSLFEFDYDVTMMVFFLNADERIYGRFGGRDARGPDERQSLAGLHHAMQAALDTHERLAKEADPTPKREPPRYIRDVATGRRLGGHCLHCHQVREILNADLQRSGNWTRDDLWRYPLPENLGMALEVDRGNVVERVEPESAAARAGLAKGDIVQRLNGLQVRSFADAQHALDRAPKTGSIQVSWERDSKAMQGELKLAEGWRRTDISWRPSLQRFVPTARLSGKDLSAKEKEALGLSAQQLAFRQYEVVHAQAREAGVRGGDIILGIDGKKLGMDAEAFQGHVRRNYVVGDRVVVNLLRAGERLNLPMTFR